MFGFHTGQATKELAGMGVCEAEAQGEEGPRGQSESGAFRPLCGQGTAAVGDIDQHYTENVDKKEA